MEMYHGFNDGGSAASTPLMTRDAYLCNFESSLESLSMALARSMSKSHLIIDGEFAAKKREMLLDEFIHPFDHWVCSNQNTYFAVFCAFRDCLCEYENMFRRALALDSMVGRLESHPDHIQPDGEVTHPSVLIPRKYHAAMLFVSNTPTDSGAFFRFIQGREEHGTEPIHQGP